MAVKGSAFLGSAVQAYTKRLQSPWLQLETNLGIVH